jgi:hypothetical protein
MSKEGALKVMEPPMKALMDRMPSTETLAEVKETGEQAVAEVRQISLRASKTITRWWRALPNNGARAGVVAGFGFVIGLIAMLPFFFGRRSATFAKKEAAARP